MHFTPIARVTAALCLLLFLGGCAGGRLVEPAHVSVDPVSRVVVFSVNTSTLKGSAIKQYGGHFWASHFSLRGYETFRLSDGDIGRQLFVLEPTKEVLQFGQFTLARGGSSKQYHFETVAPGPRVKLAPGEIAYLGRLEIEDIEFEKHNNWTTDTPTAIKLVFRDASEEDLPVLQEKYDLFRDRKAVKQIIGRWGKLEYEAVRFAKMTSLP
jgi:hypothetical protein